MNNNEKGNLLEDIVESIERFILEENPSIKENNLTIERRKRIRLDEVLHEYDLFVKIDIGSSYDSIYVFECKNWEASIDKNEIVIFSEKVNVINAAKGFFIAKSFSKDAIAQAAKNQRIELVIASEANNVFPLLIVENGFEILSWDTNIAMLSEKKQYLQSFDQSLPVSLDGKFIDLNTFIIERLNDYVNSKYAGVPHKNKFQFIDLSKENIRPTEIGTYNFRDKFEIDLSGHELYSGQTKIYGIGIISRITFSFVPPKILWHFNIESRGRVGYYEYPFSGGAIRFKLTGIENGKTAILERLHGDNSQKLSFVLR